MQTPAAWSAMGSRATAKGRRQAGLLLLVAVTLIGTIWGYRWSITWPIRLELGEYHDSIPPAFSPDGATIATTGFRLAGVQFWTRPVVGSVQAGPIPTPLVITLMSTGPSPRMTEPSRSYGSPCTRTGPRRYRST